MRRSRSPVLPVASLVVGGVLAACSGSVPNDTPATTPPRDVRMVEAPVPEEARVSPLEAGLTVKAAPRARPEAASHQHHATAAAVAAVLEPAPTVSETSMPAAELVPAPVPAEPADEPVVLVGRGVEPSYDAGPGFALAAASGRRDPVIIIRGGRGGVDDDCDIHRPGARRLPLAINQVAPPRMAFPRGGIR
ncbi:MAG: hypothetical protein IT352_07775 [Gemmatimonadales bacterium]|nr:hypothetical protein [Gemmatimonadales bacterium]